MIPGLVNIRTLPPTIREGIRKAFKATGCMDLYRGDARQMLDVIAQELTERGQWIANIRGRIGSLYLESEQR